MLDLHGWFTISIEQDKSNWVTLKTRFSVVCEVHKPMPTMIRRWTSPHPTAAGQVGYKTSLLYGQQ